MTAAAKGVVGQLRHDPFAMLPFCGYNMGDYFGHWLEVGKKTASDKLPKIFHVNWFKRDEGVKFLWPGYGDNARVLKWMFERVSSKIEAERTAIGFLPKKQHLDLQGLSLKEGALEKLLEVDPVQWAKEVEELKKYFSLFGTTLPKGMKEQLAALEKRVSCS
jgi:phosphoenolpyruvate carboxykinase (GTP)